jgi:hypothetical protein
MSSRRRLASLTLASLLLASVAAACGDDSQPATGGSGGAGGSSGGAPSTGGMASGGAPSSGGAASQGGSTTTSMGGSGGEDPWSGPVVSLTALDLGEDEIGDSLWFPIPDRTLGLTTHSEASSPLGMGIASLRPPGQNSVILDAAIPGTGLAYFVDAGALNGGSPLSDLPQALPVVEGTWLLRLGAQEGLTSARSWVYVRRTLDGEFHGGALDINVHIAPGSGASQAYMTGVINNLFSSFYTPLLGLTPGNINFTAASSSFDVVDSNSQYRQMLASSSTANAAPALNLFVIGDFGGELDSALGIAGGIPGSPMVHGTPRSGVAYTPTGDQGYDASVLAHEIGHLAGLFHTSEYQITAFDPLSDTPECANPGNPQGCPDVSNVMFPIAYGGASLSQLQRRVVWGSALYRGILQDGGSVSAPLLPAAPLVASPLAPPSFTLASTTAPASVGPGVDHLVHGHWCGMSGDLESAVASSLSAAARARLVELAADDATFDVARGRAISLLARTAEDAGDVDAVVALAQRALALAPGRRARLAALAALDSLSPADLAPALEAGRALEDPVVALSAATLGL